MKTCVIYENIGSEVSGALGVVMNYYTEKRIRASVQNFPQ